MSTGKAEQEEFEVTVEREDFVYHAMVTVPTEENLDPRLEITRRFPNSASKEERSIHEAFRMPKYLNHLRAIAELVEKAETKLEEIES